MICPYCGEFALVEDEDVAGIVACPCCGDMCACCHLDLKDCEGAFE